MCVVTNEGHLQRVNSALAQSLSQALPDLLGTRFIDHVCPEERERIESLFTSIAENREPVSFSARLAAGDGSVVCIECRAESLGAAGPICIVGNDVSEGKVTESALHREEDFVSLLQIAAVASNEASSLEDALATVIAAICARRGLSLGHSYLVTEPGVLEASSRWFGEHQADFAPLIQATEARTYLAGEGLPGMVLRTATPLWVDIATDPTFLRREPAQSCGIRSAFAFPLTLGSEVLGVLEFFSTGALAPDEGMLEVMNHVGAQLGRVAERNRARDALRDIAERSRRIVETANDAFIGMDRHGFITEWNTQAEEVFGWSRKEALGRELAETLIPPGLRSAHKAALGRYLETGAPVIMNRTLELSALHRDGHELPIELTVWPLVQRDGLTFNAFLRDVTERRIVQDEMVRARDFAETVVSSTIDGVFAFDESLKLTEWNQAMEKITGIGRSEALGQRAFEVLSSLRDIPEQELFRATLESRSAGFSNLSWSDPASDTTRFYDGSFAPLQNKDGKAVGGIGLLHDITERKMLEDGLRATSERVSNTFRLSFTNALIGMAMVSLDGHLEQVNPALCSLLGRSEEELLTTTAERVTHEDDVIKEAPHLERILSGTVSSYQIEKRLLHASGQSIWVLLAVSAVTDSSGRLLHLIHQVSDITARKRAEEELTHQALHDSLTGLPNRTLLLDRLDQALARSQRWPEGYLAVMFVDFDRFKVINDGLGHQAGDRALVAIARRLEGLLRPSDTVARFGGDEFVILCEEVASVEQAREIALRIGEAVAVPVELGSTEAVLTASIGIALSRSPSDSPEGLVRDADAAMYRAKEDGRGRHVVFEDSLREGVVQTLEVETELRAAIDKGQLCLHYQPLLSIKGGGIVGAEALIRWNHPERGLLAPGEFIQIAEESGLIVDIDTWVVQEGCRRLKRWAEQGLHSMSLSVNVSAQSLSRPEFGSEVRAGLTAYGSSGNHLCLEITERVFMGVGRSTMETIANLRDVGVTLALDDFGTGYSSLSYLKRFPVDVLKVDRSFVKGIGRDSDDSAITATVINLAHNMDLAVVAEGVENHEQLEQLRRLGCDLAQGFHCGRPQSPEELERTLAA